MCGDHKDPKKECCKNKQTTLDNLQTIKDHFNLTCDNKAVVVALHIAAEHVKKKQAANGNKKSCDGKKCGNGGNSCKP